MVMQEAPSKALPRRRIEQARVTIYGTGGTIAGAGENGGQTFGYESGVKSVKTLIGQVPELKAVAELKSEQIINVGSPDIDSKNLLRMQSKIKQELSDAATTGVVVTHGTDTIEETAFFMDLTIASKKPVVLVGAMRPPTAHGADGPRNLLCAVSLAANWEARERGTMVVLNDRICSARFTTKTDANAVESFVAAGAGFLGTFVNVAPIFYFSAARPNGHFHFDVSGYDAEQGLPRVGVLDSRADLKPGTLSSWIDMNEFDGLVLAGMGAGSWPTAAGKELLHFAARNPRFPLVMSYRTGSGYVSHGVEGSCIGGGFLNPAKCRIQLQLCLALGLQTDEIKAVFKGH
ncbi:hypothetical protein CDD82_897 [Ophiocordyceps australis]|uniref:asparaginase n=1 Tax=Ophiocordyceps australis TaxID=1399860 RepID=A0A2C5YKK4_9HYPO|nr:hypothetical protein CDD82_897 [Ophiocordyceps australis]